MKNFSTDLNDKAAAITFGADKTFVYKLKGGFKKFNYEAGFVKESKEEKKR
ncbi:hypothetical protein [Coprobacter sp.]